MKKENQEKDKRKRKEKNRQVTQKGTVEDGIVRMRKGEG